MKIDKQANIIIADHARKDCPTGSISWTFIDKSVTRGQLEDIEKHRAGPTTHTVRDVGSAQPARSGRTPFTAQDDHDLMIWVTKAERNGISVKGNETFKQLEAIVRVLPLRVKSCIADSGPRTLDILSSHGVIVGSNNSLDDLDLNCPRRIYQRKSGTLLGIEIQIICHPLSPIVLQLLMMKSLS